MHTCKLQERMMETTNTVQKISEKSKKKYRAPWEKEGTYKHLQKVLRRIEGKVDDVRRNQRYITKGLDLAGYLVYDQSYIHDTVCINEVDTIILEELHNAGENGILPRDIANSVNKLMHIRDFSLGTFAIFFGV